MVASEFWQHAREDFEPQILFVMETVGATLEHADPVVKALYKAQRHFIPRLAVSRDTFPMTIDHTGKFFIRFQALPFERLLPVLKKATSPNLTLVVP